MAMHCDFNRGGIVDSFSLPDGTFWTFSQVGEAEDVPNGAGHSHLGMYKKSSGSDESSYKERTNRSKLASWNLPLSLFRDIAPVYMYEYVLFYSGWLRIQVTALSHSQLEYSLIRPRSQVRLQETRTSGSRWGYYYVDNPVWLGTTARSLVKTTTGLFVPRVERDGEKVGTNRQAIMFHALQNKKPHPWDRKRGDQTLPG